MPDIVPSRPSGKPLDEIRNEQDLRHAIVHMLGNTEDYHSPIIDQAERNNAYYRGMDYSPEVPKDMFNTRRRKRLHKDIVETTISTIHAQVVRGIPGARIEAVSPNEPAKLRKADGGMQDMLGTIGDDGNIAQMTNMMAAKALDEVMNGLWYERKEYVSQSLVVLQSLIEGVGFRVMHPYYHPRYGMLVRPRIIRRDQFLGDPEGTDLTTFYDSGYMFIKGQMYASDIERIWGVKEREYASSAEAKMRADSDSGLVRKSYTGEGDQMRVQRSMPKYDVHFMYWNHTTPNITDYRTASEFNPSEGENKNMKFIVIINRTKIANLQRGTELPVNPWWHKTYPVIGYTHSPVLHAAHGYSVAGKLTGPQDLVNILYNQFAHNAAQTGNSSWMAEKGSVRESNFKKISMPREVVMVERDALARGRIREVPPGDPGQGLFNFLQSEISYGKEQVGGASPALEGRGGADVRSGRHAQTVIEAATTQMAEFIRMLEAGHERAVWLEVSSLQQFADFYNPALQSQFGLHKFQDIDLAIPYLDFKVSLESKADMPATTIGAEINYWAALYQEGLISPYDYLRLTKVLPRLSDEWVERIQVASQKAVPGVPFKETVLSEMQAEQQQTGKLDGAVQQALGAVGGGGQPSPGSGELEAGSGTPDGQGVSQSEGFLQQGGIT